MFHDGVSLVINKNAVYLLIASKSACGSGKEDLFIQVEKMVVVKVEVGVIGGWITPSSSSLFVLRTALTNEVPGDSPWTMMFAEDIVARAVCVCVCGESAFHTRPKNPFISMVTAENITSAGFTMF